MMYTNRVVDEVHLISDSVEPRCPWCKLAKWLFDKVCLRYQPNPYLSVCLMMIHFTPVLSIFMLTSIYKFLSPLRPLSADTGATECEDNRPAILDLKWKTSSYELALRCSEYPMVPTSLVVPANAGTIAV